MEYAKGLYFSHAIKWICDNLGYNYYSGQPEEDEDLIPDWKWLKKYIYQQEEDDEHLTPLDENVLSQFVNLPHIKFFEDNISIDTQKKYEIGYDLVSSRITIPTRDELGTLVGVMGRTTNKDEEDEYKYFPLYPYYKSKVLYNLDKALNHIKKCNCVFIFESQKAVMQSHSLSVMNTLATGGSVITDKQAEKLIKLGVEVILGFDKGLKSEIIKRNIDILKPYTELSVIWDKNNLLKDKESPTDKGIEVLKYLYKNRYKVN